MEKREFQSCQNVANNVPIECQPKIIHPFSKAITRLLIQSIHADSTLFSIRFLDLRKESCIAVVSKMYPKSDNAFLFNWTFQNTRNVHGKLGIFSVDS